jgi:hypothetical protein
MEALFSRSQTYEAKYTLPKKIADFSLHHHLDEAVQVNGFIDDDDDAVLAEGSWKYHHCHL